MLTFTTYVDLLNNLDRTHQKNLNCNVVSVGLCFEGMILHGNIQDQGRFEPHLSKQSMI
jgi:hypothetical protein